MIKFHFLFVFLCLMFSCLRVWIHALDFDPIKYVNIQTINRPVTEIESRLIPSEDDMPDDTLYQHLSSGGIPVYYTQNIKTSVCFDNKCRLLTITLFWNPSGRYLGFGLPEKEFLSKKDHDPFTALEYERLNRLLGDPNLPLGTISYNELVLASQPEMKGLDGISGATSKDMLSYVIEGAAYTTHKLYSILYGPTQSAVKEWTLEKISERFIHEVILSPVPEDVFWGLEILKGKLQKYPSLTPEILKMIYSKDYSLSEKALSTFVSVDMKDSQIQSKIIEVFPFLDVGRKKTVLELFKGESKLNPQTVEFFNAELLKMEIPLMILVMEIYRERGVKDPNTQEKIGILALSENQYLSQKAKDYLAWAN